MVTPRRSRRPGVNNQVSRSSIARTRVNTRLRLFVAPNEADCSLLHPQKQDRPLNFRFRSMSQSVLSHRENIGQVASHSPHPIHESFTWYFILLSSFCCQSSLSRAPLETMVSFMECLPCLSNLKFSPACIRNLLPSYPITASPSSAKIRASPGAACSESPVP